MRTRRHMFTPRGEFMTQGLIKTSRCLWQLPMKYHRRLMGGHIRTFTYTHIYTYIYIYREREREREREIVCEFCVTVRVIQTSNCLNCMACLAIKLPNLRFLVVDRGKRNSVVSIATKLCADKRRNHNWISLKNKAFLLSPKHPERL
jgi:hypothetical protein